MLLFQVNQLLRYPGSVYTLAPAEQFLVLLARECLGYRTLVEGLLLRAEYRALYTGIKASGEASVRAARDVLHHHGFRDFLRVLLRAGNHLNQVFKGGLPNPFPLKRYV